jgi:antagonist of KipI
MAYIEVAKPGMLTTVQDLGRGDRVHLGISTSGAMDSLSLRLANLLVGNAENAAALELTLTGPTLHFSAAAVVAVAGADLTMLLDGKPCKPWASFQVEAGSRLSFGALHSGCRAYIAVAGGIAVPPVMGSRATFMRGEYGGLDGRALRNGDRLPIGESFRPSRGMAGRRIHPSRIPDFAQPRPIRFISGPQLDYFTAAAAAVFASSGYTVTPNSDRMGYRLEGQPLERTELRGMLSDFIIPGSIQVPPDGQPIILMADCQMTGGYPKIGVIASIDLPYAAQRKPGDSVHFQAIEVSEAQALWREQEQLIDKLRILNRMAALQSH